MTEQEGQDLQNTPEVRSNPCPRSSSNDRGVPCSHAGPVTLDHWPRASSVKRLSQPRRHIRLQCRIRVTRHEAVGIRQVLSRPDPHGWQAYSPWRNRTPGNALGFPVTMNPAARGRLPPTERRLRRVPSMKGGPCRNTGAGWASSRERRPVQRLLKAPRTRRSPPRKQEARTQLPSREAMRTERFQGEFLRRDDFRGFRDARMGEKRTAPGRPEGRPGAAVFVVFASRWAIPPTLSFRRSPLRAPHSRSP